MGSGQGATLHAGRTNRTFAGAAGEEPDLRGVRGGGDGRPVHHLVAAGDDTRGTDTYTRRGQRLPGAAHRHSGRLRLTLSRRVGARLAQSGAGRSGRFDLDVIDRRSVLTVACPLNLDAITRM